VEQHVCLHDDCCFNSELPLYESNSAYSFNTDVTSSPSCYKVTSPDNDVMETLLYWSRKAIVSGIAEYNSGVFRPS
jgi:hypothetical protein